MANQDHTYTWRFPISIVLIMLTIGIGYTPERANFPYLMTLFGAFFAFYWMIYKGTKAQKTIDYYIYLGIVLRFTLLFAIPNLSDDIYRFIWDGRLLNAGINPFDHLPSFYIKHSEINIPGINPDLYAKLNSPNYFTIYPPVCQAVFAFATWLFPTNIWANSLVMKLFLFACEVGSLFLIKNITQHKIFKLKNASKAVLLYALNPLIIIEICGNLHFEGAMIFFLLLAYYGLFVLKNKLSALAMALSIASKLLPLIFLPFLIRTLGWKKAFEYFILVGIALVLLFLPLINGVFLDNFGDSLNLYFRRFEFNASLVYLLRKFGYLIVDYNVIGFSGPLLAFLAGLGICLKAFYYKNNSLEKLPQECLFAICLYLFCTTTVHPWYTSLPIVLCLFTNFRFPILWSGLIFMTYINYSYATYFENLGVVALEYSLVFGLLIWELKQSKRLING